MGLLVESVLFVEFWLDGGYNVVVGEVFVVLLGVFLKCEMYLICGMFNIKDVLGYLCFLVI